MQQQALGLSLSADDLARSVSQARREVLRRTGAGLAALLGGASLLELAGCANMPDALRNFELSREKLQSALAGQFPVERRVLQFFDIGLSQPQLQLQPQDNRIMTGFDVSLGETVLTKKVFHGSLGFGSGVRYEPADHTIRLARVQVGKFDIANLPSSLNGRLAAVGSLLAETLLENMSIYKMPDKIAQLSDTLGYAPGELKVTSTGLSVPFVPINRS